MVRYGMALFEALAGGSLGTLDMKVGMKATRVPGLPDSENRMTQRSLVLSQYQRVTDRRTDGHAAYWQVAPYHSWARQKLSKIVTMEHYQEVGMELDVGRVHSWVGSGLIGLGHEILRLRWVGLDRVQCKNV